MLFKAPNRLCVSLAAGARPVHPIRDGRLSYREAEFEQLAMDARRAPKHILNTHPSDQRPQTGIDARPASQVPRFPAPIPAKARTMPAHQRLRPDDRDGLEDCRKPAIQLDEEQPIAIRELDATAHLALQHGQLLPERGILRLKSALGLEE